MNKRFIMEITCGAILLIVGLGSGYAYAQRNLGIQRELHNTRKKLQANYTGPQSEMSIVSGFQLMLAQMELYHVRYSIWNQENYSKIESDFIQDEKRWEEEFKKEQLKPTGFEGGSISPMIRNMHLTAFVEKRIAEVKKKFLNKE